MQESRKAYPKTTWNIEQLVDNTEGYKIAQIDKMVFNAFLAFIIGKENTLLSTDLIIKQVEGIRNENLLESYPDQIQLNELKALIEKYYQE